MVMHEGEVLMEGSPGKLKALAFRSHEPVAIEGL